MARHETLRTHFVERDGQVLQAVLPASDPQAKLALQRLSLPEGGAPGAPGELERLLAELTQRPHQLVGAGVPARFVLVELGRDSHILHINMHHISRSAPRPCRPSVPGLLEHAHVVPVGASQAGPALLDYKQRLGAPCVCGSWALSAAFDYLGPCVPAAMAGVWAC